MATVHLCNPDKIVTGFRAWLWFPIAIVAFFVRDWEIKTKHHTYTKKRGGKCSG